TEPILIQIGWLEARNAAHLGPVGELDLAAGPLDEPLAFHVSEDAIDVDRGLSGDVGNLLLSEGVGHLGVVHVHPSGRFAQQMRDASGRIPSAAIDQPFVSDGFVALDQTPEEALKLGMGIDDRIEILRLADHHLALDDGLNAVTGGPVARQDSFAGEAQGYDLAPARPVSLVFRQYSGSDEHHFIALSAGVT